MDEQTLSAERARGIARLLFVLLVLAILVALLAIPPLVGDYQPYGMVVLAIAVSLGVVTYLTRRAVLEGRPVARRMCLLTGGLTIVLSIPLMPVGLLTVVAGVGLLFMTLSAERESEGPAA